MGFQISDCNAVLFMFDREKFGALGVLRRNLLFILTFLRACVNIYKY